MSKDETKLEFDAGIRKAYDAMGPTQDARERVRVRLVEEQRTNAQANASHPHRKAMIILPLAAGIAAIAVVLSVGALSKSDATKAELQPNAVVQKNEEKQPSTSGTVSLEVAAEEDAAMDAAEAANVRYAEPPYQAVTLDNGKTYEVGALASIDPASDSLETAWALDKDGNAVVECTVAQGRYVRFADDGAWYELVPSS